MTRPHDHLTNTNPVRRSLVSTRFRRGEQPLLRGLDAARHLIADVAQWNLPAGLDIVIAVLGHQVRLVVTPIGAAQPAWEQGVRHALRQVV